MARFRGVFVLSLALGCSFDATGLGNSDGSSSGESSTGQPGGSDGASSTSATTESSASTGMTSASTMQSGTSSPTTGDSTTGTPNGPAIEISDGPTYDFGIVEVPMTGTHDFTVTNIGDDIATSVTAQTLGGPFSIASNDCPGQLMPEQSCTITVELSPMEFGAVSETLTVDYGPDPDAAVVDLEGAGGGSSGNLVVNGDAEDNSTPPNGWTEQEGDTWYTPNFGSTLPAHGGNRLIYPGQISPLEFAELYQDIDVTPYATAQVEGALQVDFSGWGISGFADQDNYRYVVEFHDGGGVLGMPLLDTDWQLGNTWIEYTATDTVPATATFVRIRLRCQLLMGVICDGGFDDMRLAFSYAP